MLQRVLDICGPSILDKDGRNALFYALPSATQAIPQLLLQAGVSMVQPDGFGVTPLAFGVTQNVDELEPFLYSFPSNEISGVNEFATALHALAASGDADRFNVIIPFLGPAINLPVGSGQYLLHLLIDNAMPQALQALAQLPHFNPNNCSRSFPHPLHYLLMRKATTKEWLTALLALPHLDVNARSSRVKARGQTPLCAAVVAQDKTMIEVLLEDERCQIDLPNELGQTPLLLAIGGDTAIIEQLISAGALVDAAAADGDSAIMRALELPRGKKCAALLRKAGADPNLWYSRGKLPAHIKGSGRPILTPSE
jgi:ankyrin repeat protein